MLCMDIIAEIRRRYHISKESISSIASSLGISRTTVRKHLDTLEDPAYRRLNRLAPKLGPYKEKLTEFLEENAKLPKKQRRTAKRLFDALQEEGYAGAYDSVQRFTSTSSAQASKPGTRSARAARKLNKPTCRWRLRRARCASSIGAKRPSSLAGWCRR